MIISAKSPIRTSCQAVVDIGFILDSTGSVRVDYRKEKEFLKFFTSSFGVSSKGTRAGVVTFSNVSELSIKLNDHSDISSFHQAVDNIPLMGLTGKIDKALRLAQRKLFSLTNGGRVGVPKLLILLTDGSQAQDAGAADLKEIADELRADGIDILVVGVGSHIKKTELIQIAGNKQNMYIPTNFDELIASNFMSLIKKDTCEKGNAFRKCCRNLAVFNESL